MHAVHRTVLAIDVEGFGDRRRTSAHQVAVREGLYRALTMAFSLNDIPWDDCHIEDRGDGVFVLAPPEVAKALFVESLPGNLVGALREHNAVHSAAARIRLRMALHAGEVRIDGHGATGPSINLAFRLLEASEFKSALARSRGILALIVSSWFFDEVVRNHPAVDPSDYREIQVSVKETDTTAWIALPDRGEAPAVPHQLPVAPFLVGRGAELDRLSALLDTKAGPPVCLINGTAGVGKTSLALHWAHQVADHFPDGQLYTNLNGFGPQTPAEPGEVLYSFLHALGIDPAAIPTTLETKAALYRSLLAQRRMLVVIDNARDCEQVRPLIPGTTSSAVIITSRDRLVGMSTQIDVDRVALDVLDTDVALQLLAHRIGRERIDEESHAATILTDLCAGLPLALTIMAARAAVRPRLRLQRLVAELADERTRLDAITLGIPDLDLRSVFSWSYQQLPEQAAALFRLLGLHPGPDINVNAAASLAGMSLARTRRSIDSLLDANLLDESLPDHFRMHDLLRAYSQDLATTIPNPIRPLTRLFDHYLVTADQADRFITPQRYRIPLDVDEVTASGAAIDGYDSALDWFTTEQGNLVSLCQLEQDGFETRCWQLAYILRGFFFLTKRLDAWIQSHEAALNTCLRSGDRPGEAITRNNLGRALLETGRQDEATTQYERARQLFAEIGDRHGLSNALANQATVLRRQGRFDEALHLNQQALAYYRDTDARRNIAITLRSMSRVEMEMGRFADAARHAQEALDVFICLDMQLEAAKGFTILGLIRQRQGNLDLAEEACQHALEISRRCGSRYEEARALHRLGAVAVARGSKDEARRQWNRALDLYRSLGAAKADDVAADLSS